MAADRMYRTIIADDEPTFCCWLHDLLNTCTDFEVIGETGDGQETIEAVEVMLPDLLIADVNMPKFSGIEVARHVHDHHANIRVILVSADETWAYERIPREGITAAFIPKTALSIDALRQALRPARRE